MGCCAGEEMRGHAGEEMGGHAGEEMGVCLCWGTEDLGLGNPILAGEPATLLAQFWGFPATRPAVPWLGHSQAPLAPQ